MIKLTYQNGSESKTFSFDHAVVTIGYGAPDQVTLALPDSSLKSEHVKIVSETGRFIAFNTANDPFVALNGLPFAKQTIVTGDILEVGKAKIYFEGECPKPETQQILPTETPLSSITKEVDHLIKMQPQDGAYSQPPRKTSHIIEEEDDEEISPPLHQTKFNKEETPDEPSLHKSIQPLTPEQRWALLLKIVVPVLVITFLVATVSYLSFSGKSHKQEIRAARGLADIGMALTYAQLNHLKPVQQHWANPQFLDQIFEQVLGKGYPPLASISAEGNFKSIPYFLRIYTSHDSSKFIAIAQPEPSLLQWLIPKSALIIDSTTMHLHRIADLRSLNRLLVNAKTLDPLTSKKIAAIIGKSPILPLSQLDDLAQNMGFRIPQRGEELFSSTERYVYNAPRYYPVGDRLLREALKLQNGPATSTEVSKLQHIVESYSELPNMILYATQGKEVARASQQALLTFAPVQERENGHFHLGVVDLDTSGKVVSSLLLGEELAETEELITEVAPPPSKNPLDAKEGASDETLDLQHPLFLQFSTLLKERKGALQSISQEIIQLVQLETESFVEQFEMRIDSLLKEFERVAAEQEEKVENSISQLYHEYSGTPISTFLRYADAAGLSPLINALLKTQSQEMGGDTLTPSEFSKQIHFIKGAQSLEQLAAIVNQMAQVLTLDYVPNPEILIKYQGEFRATVLTQLNQILLSSDSKIEKSLLNKESPLLLKEVLHNIWVEDPEEINFYLTELSFHLDS